MSSKSEEITPENSVTEISIQKIDSQLVAQPNRLSKLKLAFLYVLIGGLAASALIAIVALLIGSFSSEIQKALLTIFIFFSHGLFILALLWADRDNEVGRTALPTTIFVLALANMVTTTLATWEIISNDTAWHALGLYILMIGAVFIIKGIFMLSVNRTAVKRGVYITAGSVVLFVIALVPWVLHIFSTLDPLYFRIVAAIAIFASTAFLITLTLRGIVLAHNRELKIARPVSKVIPAGLLAIYITLGTIAGMVWFSASLSFLIDAVQTSEPSTPYDYSNTRYY